MDDIQGWSRAQSLRISCAALLTGILLTTTTYADFSRTYNAHHPIGSSPVGQGWTPLNFSNADEGTFVTDDDADNGKAWQVSNAGASNPRYTLGFNLNDQLQLDTYNDAVQYGWQLSARARFVENMGETATQGITAYFENQVFSIAVEYDSAGNLRAHIPQGDTSNLTFQELELAPAESASNYFDYSLSYEPSTNTASFYFDGQLLAEVLPGFSLVHEPLFQFGSGFLLGGSGRMNYSEAAITFYSSPTSSPSVQQGDFNGDGNVDLGDFAIWRDSLGRSDDLSADADNSRRIDIGDYEVWKQNFGQRLSGALSDSVNSPSVPEPSSMVMMSVAALACLYYASQRSANRH